MFTHTERIESVAETRPQRYPVRRFKYGCAEAFEKKLIVDRLYRRLSEATRNLDARLSNSMNEYAEFLRVEQAWALYSAEHPFLTMIPGARERWDKNRRKSNG